MWRSIVRRSTQITGASLAAGTGYGYYLYQTDEGTSRAIRAYGAFVPVVLHYRWVEAKHKYLASAADDQDWKDLDVLYAKKTVAKLGELQGVYTKYGQTAAGFTNTFSDVWIQELRKLESQVPPRPVQDVYQTIVQETGKPVEETFATFDPVPLGSASIGQVHKATLQRDGRTVAVKVQYDDAERLFRHDVHTVRSFCVLLAPENVVVLEALEKQNEFEFDYHMEADNLRQVAANMKRHGFMPKEVVVPEPLEELTTRRMLVMEFLEGPKLIDGMRSYFAEWALENGTTLEALEHQARKRIEEEGVPAKYNGPSAWQIDIYRRYLKSVNVVANVAIGLANCTLGWVGVMKPLQYRTADQIPPNTPRIIDTLMRVHGYQLMADGFFQCDPHGGNFILLPDGRIGLIDYGATKRFTQSERWSACLLFAALARNDEQRLFEMSDIGGYKSKYGRKDTLMKLLQFGYDSWGQDVTGGKNIQQFIDELKNEDPWEEVPDNFVMAQFMSIRLRSLALGMNHPIKCSEWWGPIGEEILKRDGKPYEWWDYDKMRQRKPEVNIQKHKFG